MCSADSRINAPKFTVFISCQLNFGSKSSWEKQPLVVVCHFRLCKVLSRVPFLAMLIKGIVHHYISLVGTNHTQDQTFRGNKVIHSIDP